MAENNSVIETALLDKAKLCMHPPIKTKAFDADLLRLIRVAEADISVAGIIRNGDNDDLYDQAVLTYVRMNFGEPSDYDRLKKSYDEQKAQMSMHTGNTEWSIT